MTQFFAQGFLVLPKSRLDELWVKRNYPFIGPPPWKVYSCKPRRNPTLTLVYEDNLRRTQITEGFFVNRFIPAETTVDTTTLL